jgi:hypothetical protein
MAATWSLPAILPTSTRQTYRKEVRDQPPATSITWQQGVLASEDVAFPADISLIQSWLERRLELATMRKLARDWDGLGAEAPDLTVIDRADHFLRMLQERDPANPPMRVVLSADSSIAFEWVRESRFIQAEITEAAEVEWLIATPGMETEFQIEKLEGQFSSNESREQEWRPAPRAVESPSFVSER